MDNLENLWEQILDVVRTKVAKPSFDSWFGQTRAVHMDRHTFVIETVNAFIKEWLEDKYTIEVSEALYSITGEKLEVSFVVADSGEMPVSPVLPAPAELPIPTTIPSSLIHEKKLPASSPEIPFSMLNSKYTFETFVIGTANRFAHAASLAVAESPGSSYNPLFIYGGSGLGKTHLLQAIGHFVKSSSPSAKVVYLSSEKFMNEFINSISENKAEEFRQKYRKVDVLLIDDIQFFEKKVQTQEEFFHTFNALYEDGKQIVISSDRSPNELQTLEDRLRSRFGWGLITDISPPDLETRIAILRKKAIAEGLEFPDDVMMYIANSFESNIRELEGALVRSIAYSSMVNKDIDLELVMEALKNIIPNRAKKMVSILDIQKVVSQHYQIKLEDFEAKSRKHSVAFPRQVAMYLARELTDVSLPKIGESFGGRDHTTVLHAHSKISQQLQKDAQLQQQLTNIQKSLQI